MLVNDEPITAYEIQQRTAFLALNAGGGGPDLKAKAEARWAQIDQGPEAQRARCRRSFARSNVKSREEAQAVQKEFVTKLQQNMIEQMQAREPATRMLPKFRKEAQEELIEERLKLQEAKRQRHRDHRRRGQARHQGPRRAQQDDGGAVRPAASRAPASTSRPCARGIRAQFAWREVVRRRGQMLISINQRDVERMISASASEAGEDTVELQVQKITLPTPARWIRAPWPGVTPKPRRCGAGSAAARPCPAWPRRPATPGSRT